MKHDDPEHHWYVDFLAAKGRPCRKHHRYRGPHTPAYKYDNRGPARQKDIDNFADTIKENERYTCRINGCDGRPTGMLTLCRKHFHAHRVRGHPLLGPAKMRKCRKYVKRYCERYWVDGTFRVLTHRAHGWLTEHIQPLVHSTVKGRSRKRIMADPQRTPEHSIARRLYEHQVIGKDIVLALVAEWYFLRVHHERLAASMSVNEFYECIDVRLGTAILRLSPVTKCIGRTKRLKVGRFFRRTCHEQLDRVVAGLIDKYPNGLHDPIRMSAP